MELEVSVNGQTLPAVAFTQFVPDVQPGDQVVLNTTARRLSLGSGGYDFVMVNLSRPEHTLQGSGHIMKLRYTPYQCRVLSVEEEASPYRETMADALDLAKTPVIVGELHSQLVPAAAVLARRGLSAAYVMTDGACLPIAWSKNVRDLKARGLLKGTVTAGNAYGGDLEAVNLFSALLAAQAVFRPDVILVMMGPGIVGTGTKWGFTGVEQGILLNAADTLGGIPVAIPRVSFADARERHRGLSHHTVTALMDVCKIRALIPVPILEGEDGRLLQQQVQSAGLHQRHEVVLQDGNEVFDAMDAYQLRVTTMGRKADADRAFFQAAGAAAALVAERFAKKDG